MPVKRDPRTGRWFFRTTVLFADGRRDRVFGTPGVPGPYADLAPTKVGAQAAERRAISEALTGTIVRVEPTATEAPKTIREHAETFVETYKPESKPSERRTKQWTLDNHLLPFFGDMTIAGLKQTDLDTWARSEIKRGMSVKTINNRLAVLSTLIKYVTGEKSKLRFKLAGMTGEIAAVESSDVDRLLDNATDDRYRVVVLLAIEAGLRVGEIRGLQWTDLKDGQLTVRRALDPVTNEAIAPKHNKSRTIPLAPRLASTLTSMQRRGLWVVSRLDGGALGYWTLIEAIGGLYDLAGVARPPMLMHCLRHTFGTVMARKVPLPVLQKLMGHSDVQTTLRYIDVNEDDKRDAITAVFGVAATRQRGSS